MEIYPECTNKCKSKIHGRNLNNAISKGTPSQIRSYFKKQCQNFMINRDDSGRNVLHVAASYGISQIVEWLLEKCEVNPEIKDSESGWTALHRSFFYGQLSSARVLIKHLKNSRLLDHEGLSPFDLLLYDRQLYISYSPADPQEAFVWGSNTNYNLGLGKHESCSAPELMDKFQKEDVNIQQIVMSKFHTAFLTNLGALYTCGYGHGGRLGLGETDTVLVPTKVKAINQAVIQVAAPRDHMILLTEEGQVWTCGLNTYHQLGHLPPPDKLLTPKPISQKLFLSSTLIGVSAGRFHSIVYSKDAIFSFGLNAGQLGHQKGDRTIAMPHKVTFAKISELKLNHVAASDGATIFATTKGEIYVIHEYMCRKITSKLLDVKKICIVGGKLDVRCGVAGLTDSGGNELKVAILTNSGKVYLWLESQPVLRRCLIYSGPKQQLLIKDFDMNVNTFILCNQHGQAFMGQKFKEPQSKEKHQIGNQTKALDRTLKLFLDVNECFIANVKPLVGIYRANRVSSDPKGKNYAILQSDPKIGLLQLPTTSLSTMKEDLLELYKTSSTSDLIHDIVIKVGNNYLPAHKFILASQSEYFKKIIFADVDISEIIINDYSIYAVKECLQYIYSGDSIFLHEGNQILWPNKVLKEVNGKTTTNKMNKSQSNQTPLDEMRSISKKWALKELNASLQHAKLIGNKMSLKHKANLFQITFSKDFFPELCDVILTSNDGTEFQCHKCVLFARLEYFRGMFSCVWIETSRTNTISFPISSKLLSTLIDYIYSENEARILKHGDITFICETLIIAEQFLIARLKEICEVALINYLTLKNVADLLEFSVLHRANQLRISCLEYISLNVMGLMETRLLDILSPETMDTLTSFYRNQREQIYQRQLKTYDKPAYSDLEEAELDYPVDDTISYIPFSPPTNQTPRASAGKSRRNSGKKANLKPITLEFETLVLEQKVLPVLSPLKLTEPKPAPINLKLSAPKWTDLAHEFPGLGEVVEVAKPDKNISQSFNSEKKTKLSQKQKKALKKNSLTPIDLIQSPISSCPWANLALPNSPPQSFWSSDKSIINSPLDAPAISLRLTTLNEIQKDQAQEETHALAKPLHLINMEEEAIEELLELYNARNHPEERITVERILPTKLATPVWKCNKTRH